MIQFIRVFSRDYYPCLRHNHRSQLFIRHGYHCNIVRMFAEKSLYSFCINCPDLIIHSLNLEAALHFTNSIDLTILTQYAESDFGIMILHGALSSSNGSPSIPIAK